VFDTLSENIKKDLQDGKFDKVNWEALGTLLWEKAKPQIIGGANDYLKNSSWGDGKVVATWVIQKVLKFKTPA
jgi:hypothetical protein